MEAKWQTIEEFNAGLLHKKDVTQMPGGALILGSKNVVLNDGDRITVRKGSELFGASSSTQTPIKSMYTFKKRDGSEIMMRSYGTVLEYYHPDTAAWTNLYSGYTTGQIFGFADHNVNTDNSDFVYFCNAIEPYSRWNGAYTMLNGALSGGETEVVVDGVLTEDVFYSGTASVCSTTTIDIATSSWATDVWNDDFYVLITDGAQINVIANITDTTTTRITFDTITGLSGTPTFQIRKLKFSGSGNLRIGTTTVSYTGFDDQYTFSGCGSVPAALDNAAVCQSITEYPANPRGNVLMTLHTRVYIANITGQESTLYYSTIADATDFTYLSPRSADEGGVIDTPEGGGGIIGLGKQEDVIYIIKEDLVKTLTFTQDATDLPQIYPLIDAPGVGAVTGLSVFKVDNALIYVSKEGGVKEVSRVSVVDYAEPKQISDPIVNLVNDLVFDASAGFFFKQKMYITCRESDSSYNNVILTYNFQKKAWEAPIYGWGANCFTIYGNKLYFGSSTTPEVYKAEIDTYTDNEVGYQAVARFSYNNFGSATNPKEFGMLFLEGYISESTTINIKLRYNYLGTQEIRESSLAGTETDYIVKASTENILGNEVLGINPLGLPINEEDVPNELQKFRVYFTTPNVPFYEVSLEVSSDEAGSRWEILRFGYDVKLLPTPVVNNKKALK